MAKTTTTARPWRYVWTFGGVNYAAPDVAEPSHAYPARTLADVSQALRDMARYGCAYGQDDVSGAPMLRTPGYGEPGDYARVYVLQSPGPDAAIAHAALIEDMRGDYYAHYVGTFGPRGGIAWVRA